MLTARICDNYDFIALQALYTDDFERCEFLTKFIDEVRGNMQKLWACVRHSNHPHYSKIQPCIRAAYKDKVAGFSSIWI